MDGHFWVERDGKIIDSTPAEKEFMQAAHYWEITQEREYLPANFIVQKIMKLSCTADVIFTYNKETGSSATTLAEVFENSPIQTPQAQKCFKNAFYEQWKNGGTVVFGSMGYKAHWTTNIFWEYGGIDYVLTDFLSTTTTKRHLFEKNFMIKFATYLADKGLNKKQILKRMALCCK